MRETPPAIYNPSRRKYLPHTLKSGVEEIDLSARLMSPRTGLLRISRPRCRNARLLELLYLACALLLGTLLAATTTLAAAPLRQTSARSPGEQRPTPRAVSRVVHIAPRADAVTESGEK